ncbi:hypothetical protein [Streptomyces cellostaticus]|uniref:hypothetical protein n=1 Tax=Streptomyces cellostaticus TaxID=67285 RepID=UPI000AA50FF2|nr:hypothetical protein [Streptomyces cellostaticus]
MNTSPQRKKTVAFRIPRAFAVCAAVGITCAAGMATATSAVAAAPATHVATKAAPAWSHGGDGGSNNDANKCANGLLDLLNFCN